MVCPHCDRKIADGSEKCEYCGLTIEPEVTQTKAAKVKKPSLLLGSLGGLIGSILGGALIVLASQFAGLGGALAGMALAALTLNGCRLFARRLTPGGITVCVGLISVAAYISDRLDWALRIVSWHNEQAAAVGAEQIDIVSAFLQFYTLLNSGTIDFKAYMINLIFLYLCCVIGIIGTLRAIMRRS